MGDGMGGARSSRLRLIWGSPYCLRRNYCSINSPGGHLCKFIMRLQNIISPESQLCNSVGPCSRDRKSHISEMNSDQGQKSVILLEINSPTNFLVYVVFSASTVFWPKPWSVFPQQHAKSGCLKNGRSYHHPSHPPIAAKGGERERGIAAQAALWKVSFFTGGLAQL